MVFGTMNKTSNNPDDIREQWTKPDRTRMISGTMDKTGLEAADVFGDRVEGDAFGAGDVLFGGVVLPGREDE